MPIGIPRIIYSWGEELPAQWVDIYNFIFRRRMVFLMQYLDDELCNQICGLLINIHMEDRSQELEKKETEKTVDLRRKNKRSNSQQATRDLLNTDEDLGIEEIYKREQYTLQKITTDWLNWNAQFFDYTDEPYLFHLASLLTNDFNDSFNKYQRIFNTESNISKNLIQHIKANPTPNTENTQSNRLNVYSPFMTHNTNTLKEYSFKDVSDKRVNTFGGAFDTNLNIAKKGKETFINKVTQVVSQKNANITNSTRQSMEKMLGQQLLQKEYKQSNASYSGVLGSHLNVLSNSSTISQSDNELRDYYRKKSDSTEKTLIEEESQKVFVIINSFGGSVGNGITVHDALAFIKAGSMTLALGVAASAASLVLAGGSIGERYVTEGCHTMIHQPESNMTGQASDIWIDSQEIMKIRNDVADIYSLSTARPRHKILRDLDRDFYLTASETISYGLADEIATNQIMHEIVNKVSASWGYHDSKQQLLLENR